MFRLFSAAVVIAAATATQGIAAELEKWGTEGDWEILIDPEVGNGCLMQKTFDGGTLVRVGVNPEREGGFFAAYNAEWTDIVEGETASIRFDFPDAKFGGEIVGAVADGLPGGYAFFDNPDFINEFTKRLSMTVTGSKGRSVDIDLKGTTRGVAAVRKCQDAQPE